MLNGVRVYGRDGGLIDSFGQILGGGLQWGVFLSREDGWMGG